MKAKHNKTEKKISEREKIDILDRLGFHLYKKDFHPTLHDDVLEICASCLITIPERGEFALNFEVDTEPSFAAEITLQIVKFARSIHFEVEIYDPYALVIDDEKEEISHVLFGEEAMFYYRTGELPPHILKELDGEKFKSELVNDVSGDPQKKVDTILDQISQKGMDSLKESEKKFLIKYSKENIHNHGKPNTQTNNDNKD